jgi:hypothetical protein
MKILSFDPGGNQGKGASGWCYQSPETVYALGDTQDLKGLLKKWDLEKLPVDHVVVEGYRPIPGKRGASYNRGKPLAHVENVGVVKAWADFNDLPITEYFAKLKPTQEKHSGVKASDKRKDVTHKLDAFNHGWWKLHELGLVQSKLEKQMKKDGLI